MCFRCAEDCPWTVQAPVVNCKTGFRNTSSETDMKRWSLCHTEMSVYCKQRQQPNYVGVYRYTAVNTYTPVYTRQPAMHDT